mmetsp:Transcript_38501/g.93317  ORF Transcript_38501/g.93317 Transcript_38501/m.93317 type:complete len:269 (-) Transcript_38501:79-885(-)
MSNEDSTLSQEGASGAARNNSAAAVDGETGAPVESTKNNDVDSRNDGEMSQNAQHQSYSPTQRKQQQQQPARMHLIIANIQKIANVRSMLKAAVAFGCHSVVIVGQENNKKRHNFFPAQFQQATKTNQIKLHHFDKWKECIEYLKNPCNDLQQKHNNEQQEQQRNNNNRRMYIVGVEIDERSRLFDDEYFQKYVPKDETDIALLMGNEGQGIIPQYLEECHQIIRIPQYGSGTASLNVNVACNIVLYKFQHWNNRILQQQQDEDQGTS